MLKTNYCQSKKSVILALLLSVTTVAPIFSSYPAAAQLFRNQRNTNINRSYNAYDSYLVPAGTTIPVMYEKDKILVTKEETVPVTLQVAANVKNRSGTILIPYGSEIVGEIQPAGNGSRFVAKELIINEDKREYLEASSDIVTRTEEVKKDSVDSILKGAAIGAAAAAAISAVTGDKAIATEEILGGAGLGALGGWLLGKKRVEVVSIDPETDLDLMVNSDLDLNNAR